jgi:hypothetical protein
MVQKFFKLSQQNHLTNGLIILFKGLLIDFYKDTYKDETTFITSFEILSF